MVGAGAEELIQEPVADEGRQERRRGEGEGGGSELQLFAEGSCR